MIPIMQVDMFLNPFKSPHCEQLQLAKGDYLFHTDDTIRSLFRVTSGQIYLVRQTSTGIPVIMQRARSGDVLAEASVYSSTYHCDARAVENSVLTVLPIEYFRTQLADNAQLSQAWAAHLARTIQVTRLKAEIRTLRTVSERLDAWLAEHEALPGKGGWQDIAAELGVSREALYRELARRRKSSSGQEKASSIEPLRSDI